MSSLYDRISKGTISVDEIKESMKRATSEGGQFYQSMEKQSKTLNGQLSTLKDNFNELLGTALQPISDTLRDYIIPTINDLLTGGENLNAFIEEHKTALTILTGVIITLTVAITAFYIAQNIATITLGLYTTAVTVATAVSTAFGVVLAFITSPITLIILAIGALIVIVVLLVQNWELVKEKTLEIWGKVKEFLGNVIEGIITWFKELPYKIGVFIGELLGTIIKFGVDAINWVKTEVPKIINGIVNFFKELPGKVWTWLVNTISRFLEFLSDMKTKADEGAKKVAENIINGIKELPGKMLSMGQDIVEGLWNGIQNAGEWIKEKVGEFAKGILDGMKSALGIQSPSKLFRDEVGKNIALGIGVGFENTISKVYQEMENTISNETSKLGKEMTATGNVSIERNANVTSLLNGIIEQENTFTSNVMLDGKVIASSVNKINKRNAFASGIA